MRCAYRSKLYGYNQGCRCPRCVTAMRAYKREWSAISGANLRVGKRADQKRASDAQRAAKQRAAA